jgi:hypothetical protein
MNVMFIRGSGFLVLGSLGLWVSGSLGLWVSRLLGLWVLGLWVLGFWVSGFLGWRLRVLEESWMGLPGRLARLGKAQDIH